MNDTITSALESDRVIDITTTGRKSREPRRLEMWFHNIEGRIYITGMPGSRDWYANVVANPEFTFHLKESTQADLAATARPILDETEKRAVLEVLLDRLGHRDHLERWMADSPLIEVTFAG